MWEAVTSLFGGLTNLITVKFILGSGLPGALMLGSIIGFVYMAKNHVDPATTNKLLAKGYIIRDLGKMGFLFMTFLSGVLFFFLKK